MLTACIVYVQGSAGNLLARCVALDPETVPYGNAQTADSRFREYNNWDSRNWKASEILEIDYMCGKGDFVDHEESKNKLVHRLHPGQFLDGEQNLWTGDFNWQNLIFIEPNDIETITHLASVKRPDKDHKHMILQELTTYSKLRHQATYSIPFTDMFKENIFYAHVRTLCNTIEVTFYEEYVKQIWSTWYKETCKLI